MKWFDFSKEGDEFIKKLIVIIEQENIEINGYKNRNDYWFFVDDKKYQFKFENGYNLIILDKKSNKEENEIKISNKYWHHVNKLFVEQQRINRIKVLPDISEVGRAAKKYNL